MSKSDIRNMNDDDVVYLQGYLIQNLGDEMYVFQDDSGTINVEIDDDLMQNAIAPDALVWIAATVDKEGNSSKKNIYLNYIHDIIEIEALDHCYNIDYWGEESRQNRLIDYIKGEKEEE